MIILHRRSFVAGVAALAAYAPLAARAVHARFRVTSSTEQGALVVCRAETAAHVDVDASAIRVTDQGYFAFGFAYDRKEPARVKIAYSDGDMETREVTPKERHYETQTVNGLPPRTVSPNPEDAARIEREHALVAKAREADSDYTFFSEPFDWPARGPISSHWGSQRILNGVRQAPHYGVDIAAGEGAPIHAPASGRVAVAEQFFLEGGYTMIDHGHGVFSGYMHQSKQMVATGDMVERGQLIGHVGKTGRATGPHLHWALNWFQVRLDPSLSTRSPDVATND